MENCIRQRIHIEASIASVCYQYRLPMRHRWRGEFSHPVLAAVASHRTHRGPHSIRVQSSSVAAQVLFTHPHKTDTHRSACTMWSVRQSRVEAPFTIVKRLQYQLMLLNQLSSMSVLTPLTLFFVRALLQPRWFNSKVKIIWRSIAFLHWWCDCIQAFISRINGLTENKCFVEVEVE